MLRRTKVALVLLVAWALVLAVVWTVALRVWG